VNAPAVLYAVEDAIAWITLNRPEAMNAMSPALTDGLVAAIDAVERDDAVRAVVITGAGRAFSAGGDLKSFREAVSTGAFEGFIERLHASQAMFRRVEQLARPVIAAVNGYAVAGGLELILCCDLVIAAESAMIGDGHAKYGIIPGGGSTARLPRKVPVNVAKLLLLTGELWPARALLAAGLVNQVVADGELRSTVAALAAKIARNSPLGLKHIKRLVNDGLDQPVELAARAELGAFESYVRSDDFREGLAAFAEKRHPRFSGR
jgi:enoyl-CoA hydratase/carnithine racemase